MVNGNSDPVSRDDLIQLDLLIGALWRARLAIVLFFVFGLTLGVTYVRYQGPTYVSSISLMPTDTDADRIGSLSSMSSIFSNTSDIPLTRFKRFQVALTSSSVAERLDAQGYMCMVYSQCESSTKKWDPIKGQPQFFKRSIYTLLGMPKKTSGKPDVTSLSEFISSNVILNQTKTGVLTLQFSNSDPKIATTFLLAVVKITNDYVKDNDRVSLQKYVHYLTNKLDNLSVLAQRDVLQSLLTEQVRRLMLTQVDVPYAANTLDFTPAVPKKPYFTILLFAFGSMFLGSTLILLMQLLPLTIRNKIAQS